MEEAAADETSVPEEPEPVPEETAYPVCIHVATEDGEELLEVTVPEGSSVAAALDGGVLLAAAEPDAGDAADWAADYDWYTLDEAWEKVPYDISAAVTAELEEVYGPYGFDAGSYQGQRFFPHLDSAEREQRVWADVTPRIDADDGYWIPLGTIGRASNSVYYTPENTEGSASYFTEFKKYTDPQLLADSTLYTVEVKDHSGAFSAADLPETRYVPNGQPFTIVLPLAEGVHWAVADPLTGETLDLTGVEDAESQTLTYTVPAASHPYRFSAHSDQKVIVYEAGLSGALVDLSNELVVGTQSVIVDGMVRGGLTYSDRCTPQQQSYTVLSPDNDRAAIKLVTGNAHNRRFIYRFTGWRVSGSDMVLRPGRVIDLDTLGSYMDPITHEITLNAVWTPFADGTSRIETVNFFVSLNCEIADNMSNGFASQPQSNFTSSLAYTRVRGAESLGSGHDDAMVIVPPEESSTAYEVDGELRSLTTTPYRGMTLETFPSDETIFEAIRNGGYTIKIEGVTVDKQYLTSEHFTIRW